MYLDSGKCNLQEYTKAAWVRARYTYDALNVMPVPLSDEGTPDVKHDRRGRAIAQAVPVLGPWEECFIPKFSYRIRGG
jgi:hypothetical protein